MADDFIIDDPPAWRRQHAGNRSYEFASLFGQSCALQVDRVGDSGSATVAPQCACASYILAAAICASVGILTSCGAADDVSSASGSEDLQAFSIYLATDTNLQASDLGQDDMGSLALQEEPLLTVADISSYNWQKHSFALVDDSGVTFPSPGVFGVPFVIVSQQKREYLGAFWTMLSSFAWFAPIIIVDDYVSTDNYLIEWGYPPGAEYGHPDPRENPTIKRALRLAGKLVDAPLPHSMKGYELYSWDEGTQGWRFALITGTNRNKTCEEVKTGEDVVDDGWIEITVVGASAINATLSRLPTGESVSWRQALPDCDLAIPGPDIVQSIRWHCAQLNLDLDLGWE